MQGHCTFVSLVIVVVVSAYQAFADDVKTTTISNSDLNIQRVSGNWTLLAGAQLPDGEYYNDTLTLTRDAGATILYQFTGFSIAVFGTQCGSDGNTTVSKYSIDDGPMSVHTVPPNTPCNKNFVNLYTSTPGRGPHTLVITNMNDGAWYYLASLKINQIPPTSTPPAPSQTPSPKPSPAPSPASATRRPSKIGTATIVGIALGLAVLAAIIFIGVLLRRAKSRSAHSFTTIEEESSTGGTRSSNVTPYVVNSSLGHNSTSRDGPPFGRSKARIPPPDDLQNTASSGEPSTGPRRPQPPMSRGETSQGSFNETAHDPPVDRRGSARTVPPPYGD